MKKIILGFTILSVIVCQAAEINENNKSEVNNEQVFDAIDLHNQHNLSMLIKMNANLNITRRCILGPDQTPLDAALHELHVNQTKLASYCGMGLYDYEAEKSIPILHAKREIIKNMVKSLLYAGAYFERNFIYNDAISDMLPPFVKNIEEATSLIRPIANLIVLFLFDVELPRE